MYSNGGFLIVQRILGLFCCVGVFDLLVRIPDVSYVARVSSIAFPIGEKCHFYVGSLGLVDRCIKILSSLIHESRKIKLVMKS